MSKKEPTPGGRPKKKAEVSLVRSSAAEYLTFVAASGTGGVEAVYADENIWLSQKMMGLLYDVDVRTISYHLKNVFADHELEEKSVIQFFRITAADGKTYDTQHYNLAEDMALRQIPLTMQDWETRLNRFIAATDREILQDAGKVTAEIAQAHAESEFEKYRIVQDRLPADARWSHLQANAKQPTIGKTVDDAMVAIERDNPRLKGVLPKDYARPALDKHRLGELIDLIGTIALVSPSPQPSPSGRGSQEPHCRGGYGFSGLVERARELRKMQTPAEDLLWELLRDRQLCNAKFRRQHQFGDYLCDFYCHEAKLVVECDGEPHHTGKGKQHDAKRDTYAL